MTMKDGNPAVILLVEDSPTDILVTQEALAEARLAADLRVVRDGVEALAFLRRQGDYALAPRPHLILLDLNMPRKDGRQVLAEIKKDPDLHRIPVVVLTTSKDDTDILKAYDLHANSYLVKPVNFERFVEMIKSLKQFWFQLVTLPPGQDA